MVEEQRLIWIETKRQTLLATFHGHSIVPIRQLSDQHCKAQWSLHVPYSGHYMYRTVVTIRTVQWSLYVPYSGHYMYRTVVTICTAQWSPYVPYSGHYMYRTVVTIRTASLTFNNSTICPHSCIYVFCVDLRTNSDYFPIQH